MGCWRGCGGALARRPAPAAAFTLTVNGLRRFAELAAGDTILLSRCEDALYYYVLAELYQ